MSFVVLGEEIGFGRQSSVSTVARGFGSTLISYHPGKRWDYSPGGDRRPTSARTSTGSGGMVKFMREDLLR